MKGSIFPSWAKESEFRDPPIARRLFANPAFSWIWLLVRFYLGYQWVVAGWYKFNDPRWMESGLALKGYWDRAVMIPVKGRPRIAFDWYRDFIQFLLEGEHYTWFADLVVFGQILVGLALVFGAFVGVAAFFGALMNWSFMMAGSASTNPVLFTLAILLMLAWKTAGWIGLDRWLLPALGTPWQTGRLFRSKVNAPILGPNPSSP